MNLLRRTLLAAVTAAVLLAGCGSGTGVRTGTAASTNPSSPTGSVPDPTTTAVHSRADALALARYLLRLAILPPGAHPTQAPPAASLSTAPSSSSTPDEAQVTRFATTAESMATTFAYLQAHRPPGSTPGMTGSGGTRGTVTVRFLGDRVGGMPAGVDSAQLLFSVAPVHGGGAGIRVDAQVTWLPTEPAAATVPSGDDVAVVSITETVPAKIWRQEKLPAPRQVTVTDAATVQRLRATADGLPMSLPGTRSCPADVGTRYVVAFARAAGARPDRTYVAGSCDLVSVTGPSGQTIATLADDGGFDAAYRAVLGLGARG